MGQQSDARWERTREVIRSHCKSQRRGVEPQNVEVIFGRATCQRTVLINGQVALGFAVPKDWLETVEAEHIAVVDNQLVLYAQPCPVPEPAEQCWLAVVVVDEPDGKRSTQGDGWKLTARLTYIVRHGGILRAGKSKEEALERCLQAHLEALGAKERTEWADTLNAALPAYLDQQAKRIEEVRKKLRGEKP